MRILAWPLSPSAKARLLAGVLALLAAACVPAARAAQAAQVQPAQAQGQAQAQAQVVAELEAALFAEANASRAAQGLPPVSWDEDLLAIARQRAAAQSPRARLTHYGAAGSVAVGDLLSGAAVQYAVAGENLARLSPSTPEETASRAGEALMASPAHRANLLDPRFERLAVGAVLDAQGRVVFAQVFRATFSSSSTT